MTAFWGDEDALNLTKPGGIYWWAEIISQITTSVGELQANFAGDVPMMGTMSTQTKKLVANLAGIEHARGTLVSSMQKALFSAVGAQQQIGTLQATSKALAATVVGAMYPKGTLSPEMRGLVVSIAAEHIQQGAISSTLRAMSSDLTGLQATLGPLAATVQKLSADLSGFMPPSGFIGCQLYKPSAALLGGQTQAGTVDAQMQVLTSQLNGEQRQIGAVSSGFGALGSGLSGEQRYVGSMASMLKPLDANMIAAMYPQGTIGSAITKMSAALNGDQRQIGTVAAALMKTTAALNGSQTQQGTLAGSLAKAIAALAGTHTALVGAAIVGTPNTSSTNTVTIPAHAAGNLIVLFPHAAGGSAPTKPTASGTVPDWKINAVSASSFSHCCIASFIATSNNHTSGTWTNATDMIAVVLSGASSVAPIGGCAIGAEIAFTTVNTAPAITQLDTSGKGQLLHFFASGDGFNAAGTPAAAAAGYTRQVTGGPYSGVSRSHCLVTKNTTTSDGALNHTFTGSASYMIAATVEIVPVLSIDERIDSVGSGFVTPGSSGSYTQNIVNTGCDVFVFVTVFGANAPSSVTVGGQSASLYGSGQPFQGQGYQYIYRKSAYSGSGNTTIATNFAGYENFTFNSVAVRSVSSVGSIQSNPSSTSQNVTCTSGQLILWSYFGYSDFTSSGGIQLYKTPSASLSYMSIHAATVTTTFSASANSLNASSAIVIT